MQIERGEILDKCYDEIFYCESGKTLEQVAQGGCGCPRPGMSLKMDWKRP